jgi:hypothetical protein
LRNTTVQVRRHGVQLSKYLILVFHLSLIVQTWPSTEPWCVWWPLCRSIRSIGAHSSTALWPVFPSERYARGAGEICYSIYSIVCDWMNDSILLVKPSSLWCIWFIWFLFVRLPFSSFSEVATLWKDLPTSVGNDSKQHSLIVEEQTIIYRMIRATFTL